MNSEASLKPAIRKLIHSSQLKPEAVRVIVEGLEDENVTPEDWETLFNKEGAEIAIKQKIYSPQTVRLITLRAIVIPETLQEFLAWLNIQGGKKLDEHQTVSLEFQKDIRALFPQEQLTKGINYLILNLLNKEISVDSLCWLLATNRSGSVWAYAQKEFITDVKYDLQLICDYFAGQSKKGSSENVFKCQKQVWTSLINNWGGIQQGYYKGEEYQPFAELFEKFRQYDLAAYFYQVSDRVVKKELFYEVASLQNRRSIIVVFGLKIEPKKNLIDYTLDIIEFLTDIPNIYEFMKQEFVIDFKKHRPIVILFGLDLKSNKKIIELVKEFRHGRLKSYAFGLILWSSLWFCIGILISLANKIITPAYLSFVFQNFGALFFIIILLSLIGAVSKKIIK